MPLKLGRPPRHFLQCPGVAIGIAEGSILHALVVFIDLTHFDAPANERFACLVYVSHDQMGSTSFRVKVGENL